MENMINQGIARYDTDELENRRRAISQTFEQPKWRIYHSLYLYNYVYDVEE